MPRPSRTAVLVATAGLLAGACAWDLTSSPLNLGVALGAVAVLAVCCWRGGVDDAGRPGDRRARIAVASVLVLTAVGTVIRPPVKDVAAGPLFWVGLAILATAAGLICLGLSRPALMRSRSGWAAAAATAAGLAAVVGGSHRPRIDVWILLQDSAYGFLTGRNPYTLSFPDAPRGQTTQCFTYLPGSFILGAPGRLVGDVRWAELTVLLVGWLALVIAVRRRAVSNVDTASQTLSALLAPVSVLATFALVMPATVRVVQQSWTDSLLVGLLLLAVALVVRGHAHWAVLPLAMALATKQHVVLLLPLIVMWWGWRRCAAVVAGAALICAPWLLAAPERMWTCGVTFFLDLPATHDSISYWRFLPGPIRLPLVVALTIAALWLCRQRLPRTPGAFLLGAAVVNAAFDLANKQSYLNQWWFVAQLVLAAVVAGVMAPDRLSGVTTGAGTGISEPSRRPGTTRAAGGRATSRNSRRTLLRIAGAGAATIAVGGCSLVRMIGGPGTATDSATPTNRPTVLATAVPLLGAADAATVDAAVQLLVGAAGSLAALAVTRPDLRSRLATVATAHEAHLRALAALAGTPVPTHPTLATVSATPSKAPAKPTATAFLTSAASIEATLAGAVTTRTTQATDTDVATLLASVAASATSYHAWFQAAAVAARPANGG